MIVKNSHSKKLAVNDYNTLQKLRRKNQFEYHYYYSDPLWLQVTNLKRKSYFSSRHRKRERERERVPNTQIIRV